MKAKLIASMATPLLALLAAVAAPTALAAGPDAAARVLLLQDVQPWNVTSNEDVLATLGVAYDRATSADLPGLRLAQYRTIIVGSVQPQSFYDALGPFLPAVGRWLRSGPRTLEFHGAMFTGGGAWTFELPGHVGGRLDPQKLNVVDDAASPLVAGVPGTLRWSYVSNTTLTPGNVASSATVMSTQFSEPTLMDYCWGQGRVIATGVTLEYAHYFKLNYAPILTNTIAASTSAPGCQ